MKVKVNIRDYLEENADHNDMLLVHASVDVDDLFDTNSIPEDHEFDIDLHETLAENRQIAHIWGIGDVQDLRPDLDDDQAWQVLQDVERRLDSQYGISWDTIEIVADELFGPKPNPRWHGRIDLTVEGCDRDEAIEHFTGLAAGLAKDVVTNTRASFDPASLRPADPNETEQA